MVPADIIHMTTVETGNQMQSDEALGCHTTARSYKAELNQTLTEVKVYFGFH